MNLNLHIDRIDSIEIAGAGKGECVTLTLRLSGGSRCSVSLHYSGCGLQALADALASPASDIMMDAMAAEHDANMEDIELEAYPF